jgi:hypothetical protein
VRAAKLATTVAAYRVAVNEAIEDFLAAAPGLHMLRDVETQFDEYAWDRGRRWQGPVTRRDLQVGEWDGTTFTWLGVRRTLMVR